MSSDDWLVYRDEALAVVHKPAGLLVHPSRLANDRDTCMSRLRDQLGQRVHPCHRLDRGTSGLLVFALTPESASRMGAAFREGRVGKTYLALTRGHWAPSSGRIDHPIEEAACQTDFATEALFELPIPCGRFPSSRYALMRFHPLTGRRHQIRRHAAHCSHHLIGDTTYGKGEHNRLFRENFDWNRLALACIELQLPGGLHLTTGLSPDFQTLLDRLPVFPPSS